MVGIFFVSVCIQTVLHLLKASVVDVDDIWGKIYRENRSRQNAAIG
jgi:hypothetical protein